MKCLTELEELISFFFSQAFHQFDCDGSGVADVQSMLDYIDQYSSRSALGEVGKSTRILQSCSLTPAFVDVYAGSSHPVEKHGTRILRVNLIICMV